jgi:hypothetical protein
VNHRPATWPPTEAIPADRTRAARSAHIAAGGRYADVQHRPRRVIRAGAFAASHMPTMPPSEIPQ